MKGEAKLAKDVGVHRRAGFISGVARYGMKDYEDAEKEFLEVSSMDKTPPPILYVKLV